MATALPRFLVALFALAALPMQLSAGAAEPVHLTSEQDHNRLLDLLHITSLRRGPDGDPTSPRAANFDESKVDPNLKLPDPLLLQNGKPVTSAAQWWKHRRPEIVAAFDTQIYGRVPKNVPRVSWKVQSEVREQVGEVPVIRKELTGHLDNSAYPAIDVNIQLTLVTPANAHGPVPVMMELGLSSEAIANLKKRFTPEQWATFQGTGPDWRSQLLERGWGYAVLIPTSIQADNGEGLTAGVIGLTNKGQPRSRPEEWGALRAWAWGASRAMDYLETDQAVDAKQVGIEGLSRYGKATLLTMAYEPRLAIAFVGSSGAGGAKIWRRNFGEQVENLASSSEYHWMAPNFLKYAGPLTFNDLPIDQHELIALCAPRPVFVSSGAQQVEGGWVDAKGMFLGAVNAGPVYRLLGKKDLGTTGFPPMETALIDGDIAFRQHSGGHTTGPNWPTFLTFASRYIQIQSAEPAHGQFEGHSDIGSVTPPGTSSFNAATNTYTLTAAGANTWYHVDNFHYLWKKSSGDMTLSADVSFPPITYDHTPDPHRKGILMFRQTLDAGGVYVGVAQHGSGLMALQFRRQRGANSEDVELNIEGPKTVQIVKQGDVFSMYVSMKGEPLHPVGASVELHFEEPFYVGLGAVSHDVNTTDKVEFAHVNLQRTAPVASTAKQVVYSTLQTISINDQFRRGMVIRTMPNRIDSPNWAPDGKSIYVHEGGCIQRIPYLNPPAGGPPQPIDTGKLVGCSGNYGLSPDGKWIAVSCSEVSGAPHEVFLLPANGGGTPNKVTNTTASSYFHAWAPDSQSLAFTQGAASKADIFTVPIDGGTERRLTSDTLNDGPDYTPDGKFIYFDSLRSGKLQIWRMKPDGSAAEQITDDDANNHSPHVSPDGKAVAFLSQQAPENGEVVPTVLKVISSSDGMIHDVVRFQGNRGSFQMYGWGDATHLAFVSYQKLPEAAVVDRPAITGVSHIAVYAADAAKTERFYVHDLGALAGVDPEAANGHRYYFAPTQFVEVLPLPSGAPSINRLDHVAFTTTNAAQLRKNLAAQKIKVPKDVEHGKDGSLWFQVTDPEGNRIEFVQPPAVLPDIPLNPLSSHIIHVGFIVHNRQLEDGFFQKVLGFRPYWFGGMKDDNPTWISQQVPDGTDWLEYMIVGPPEGRGIPPTMSAATLGVLNHFSLGVANTEEAYTLLWKGNRLDDQSNTPKIGRDAKWQLNLIDPDGTRAEVMEFHAIGTPCCSPFTATDPQK